MRTPTTTSLVSVATTTLVSAAAALIIAATTAVAATTATVVVVTASVGALVRVLEARDRIPTLVVGADAEDMWRSATGRGAASIGVDCHHLSTGVLLLGGVVDFG